MIFVREALFPRDPGSERLKSSYRHPCPRCGTDIISVRMPNSGWAHFEGRNGLSRVKHPCLHLGEGMGSQGDDKTPDLFRHSLKD